MKEQSHKSEMGAALRGDFERLRARRRGENGLIEPPVPSEPLAGEPLPSAQPEHEHEPEPAPAIQTAGGGSWLDRLRGRG